MPIFYGPIINPKSLTQFDALPQGLIAIGSSGTIDWLETDVPPFLLQDTLAKHGHDTATDFIELKRGQFLMPGFIDTHTHAPQFPNLGTGGKYQLLDWLEHLTFPEETKYSDVEYAKTVYQRVITRVLASGTTTCCYYGTIHVDGTKALADLIHASGQRAFVGKCNMDSVHCPSYYREASAEKSISDTRAFIDHTSKYPSAVPGTQEPPLVQPIVTPRFAISCTASLLGSLGSLVAETPGLRVQTHISENKAEIAFTKELFPDCASYAGVYEKFGLLKDNTILAHAVHLEDSEIELIKAEKAGISHCPTSNFNLNSGIAPVGRFLDHGLKVGLGTDVSGGYSPSIITAIQHASIASKVLALQTPNVEGSEFTSKPLSLATLLHLATLGGAAVCTLDKTVGSFEPGKAFDALLVDVGNSLGGSWRNDGDSNVTSQKVEEYLEEFFFTGDDRNISRVFVQGKWVAGVDFGV